MHKLKRTITAISLVVFTPYALTENETNSDNKNENPNISEQLDTRSTASKDTRKPISKPVVYVLPNRGAPDTSRLIGAGSRTYGEEFPYLAVLTPKHTGLTFEKQPTLYWYTSIPIHDRMEFVLISNQSPTPLLKIPVSVPINTGIHHIDLSDHAVNLDYGTEYQWSIAMRQKPEERTSDIVTSGKIERIKPAESLITSLTQTPESEKAHLYAKHGIWYDMMTNLANSIAQNPVNTSLREIRAQLLEQVDLEEVARYERN
jgi:hypothetical protein